MQGLILQSYNPINPNSDNNLTNDFMMQGLILQSYNPINPNSDNNLTQGKKEYETRRANT
jgi:hypothetical protein